MKHSVNTIFLAVCTIAVSLGAVKAQLNDIPADYLKTLNNRASKIVENLDLTDKEQALRVQEIIVIQYFKLSKIHDSRDEKLNEIGAFEGEAKQQAKTLIKNETNAKLYDLHASFLASLASELEQEQVVIIKDGMTYGVVELTYKGYLTLLPQLSDEQKRNIYRNLVEAREFAMDAGSSKAKHAWFGKYKGRINNYLSDEGYDLKKAEQALKEQKN